MNTLTKILISFATVLVVMIIAPVLMSLGTDIQIQNALNTISREGYTVYADPSGDFHIDTGDLYIGDRKLSDDGSQLHIDDYSIPRSATYTVAANDAPAHVKAQADYVCDGTADEVQIQAAIDALGDRGGSLILSEGNFIVSSPITVANTLHIKGTGGTKSTWISLVAGADCNIFEMPVAGVADVIIENMIIDGNKDNNASGHCIYFASDSPTQILLKELQVQNAAEKGIYFNYGYQLFVDHCLIRCNAEDGIYGGANVANCIYVIDSDIETNNYGVRLLGGTLHAIDNNRFEDNTVTAIHVVANYCWITKNYINADDCTGASIYIYGNGISVIDNKLTLCESNGIESGAGNKCHIANNEIWDCDGGDPILVNSSPYSVIQNNIVYDCSGAIVVRAGSHYSSVTDNIHYDRADDGYAVYCSQSDYVSIEGNIIYDSRSGDDRHITYGIYLYDAEYNIIQGNVIHNCKTANYGSAVGTTGLILKDNIGWITDNSGNSTGTGAQQTIAHGLATTPTVVILWNIENGANPYQSAAADATNIYITAVSGNDYGWKAIIEQ